MVAWKIPVFLLLFWHSCNFCRLPLLTRKQALKLSRDDLFFTAHAFIEKSCSIESRVGWLSLGGSLPLSCNHSHKKGSFFYDYDVNSQGYRKFARDTLIFVYKINFIRTMRRLKMTKKIRTGLRGFFYIFLHFLRSSATVLDSSSW